MTSLIQRCEGEQKTRQSTDAHRLLHTVLSILAGLVNCQSGIQSALRSGVSVFLVLLFFFIPLFLKDDLAYWLILSLVTEALTRRQRCTIRVELVRRKKFDKCHWNERQHKLKRIIFPLPPFSKRTSRCLQQNLTS